MRYTLALLPVLILGIMIAWGFVIGKRNVIIRTIGIGVSFIAALISVFAVKGIGYSTVAPIITPLLSGTESGESLIDFLSSAESVGETLVSVCGAFAAPLVFAAVYMTFTIITWIIGWIVSFVMMLVSPAAGKKRSPVVIIPCVILQAIITVFVVITPFSAYGSCAESITDRVSVLDKNSELGDNEIIDIIEDANSSFTVSAYRAVGGELFCNWITTFKVGEEKSNLGNEADSIGRIAADVIYLSGNKVTDYDSDEAEAIKDISDGMSSSVVLPTLLGEVIYSATDEWLGDGGSFFGVPAPDLEKYGAGIFKEAFTHLLEIFHNDARDREALCDNIDTLANTVAILAEDGIFSAMGNGGNALIDKLSGGTTVRKLVDEFGSNPGFKVLIGDVTNIGMRAIGTSLNIPENAEQIYSDFTGNIAEGLTDLNTSGASEEDKCAELTNIIKEAFVESGVAAELDDEVARLYAKMILEDFGSYGEVTKEDVADFFRAYSEVSKSLDPQENKLDNGAGSVLLLGGEAEYSSDAYAEKSLEELKTNSGAGVLAVIMNQIVEANNSGSCDDETVRRIIEEALVEFARNAGKDEELAREFAGSLAVGAAEFTEDFLFITESLHSSEAMEEVSSIITVEDLLIDPEGLAAVLDSKEAVEKEAEAIGKVFESVGEIADLLGGIDNSTEKVNLSEVAEGLGGILDGLSETSSVGSENTGKLMTAVLQSQTVRDAADLDMATATELAKAATESENGKVNYTETMTGIAAGAGVAEKLSDENAELTRDDIRELLESMNPQTAKVLKTYMNEKRIAGFGVPEGKVPLATEMISNLLDEMGDKEKYGGAYENEIDGITTLFDLLNAATAKDAEGKAIFNHGDEIGRLKTDAYSFTGSILQSNMVCDSLEKTLVKDGAFMQDPFGLNLDEKGRDYVAVKDALDKHHGENEHNRVDLIAALFGIE
jgi:hypothetical protein